APKIGRRAGLACRQLQTEQRLKSLFLSDLLLNARELDELGYEFCRIHRRERILLFHLLGQQRQERLEILREFCGSAAAGSSAQTGSIRSSHFHDQILTARRAARATLNT